MVQENHTVDCYFGGLRPYGGKVATGWPSAQNPPSSDPPHHRSAYFDWLTGASAGEHVQFDTVNLLPITCTSRSRERFSRTIAPRLARTRPQIISSLSVASPRPSRTRRATPEWNLPSVLGLADENGVSWRAYAASGGYPVDFYTQLKGSADVVASPQFIADARASSLPSLVMLWHDPPLGEHPTADVTLGMNVIWQSVDAVVHSGEWDETVFMLTWDDWGGYDDHVKTPILEYTPDNVQLAYGPRIPLLIFGGHVKPGIDSRWCGHASIPKTAIDLLGLPALGVPRVEQAPKLADLVDPAQTPTPAPPAHGSTLSLPPAPAPPITPNPTPAPPATTPRPVGDVILRDGTSLPPPNDAPLPQQPNPPVNARQ